MSAATVLTVWTGVDYLVDAWKQSKKLRTATGE
jgi:phosphatidylglycerophosphate synthase